jgi:hypothetical protein
MKYLTFLTLFLGLLWSGLWFYGARQEEARLRALIEQGAANALGIQVGSFTTRGFPNRFDTTLTDVERDGPVRWSLPFFQFFRLSYSRDHYILSFPDRLTMGFGGKSWSLEAQKWRGSLLLNDGQTESLVVEADQILARSGAAPVLKAANTLVALRPVPLSETTWDISFRTTLLPTSQDDERGISVLLQGRLVPVNGSAAHSGPMEFLGANAFELIDARLTLAGKAHSVSGSLEMNAETGLSGALTLTTTNAPDLVDALSSLAVLDANQSTHARDIIARAIESVTAIDLSITIENGAPKLQEGPL